MKDRPQKAEVDYFIGKVISNEQGEELRLTEDDAKKLQFKLIVGEIIDENYKITPKGKELIEQGKVVLTDKLEPFKDSVCKLLQAIYTGAEFKPEDERQTVVLTTNKNFGKKEFQELWGKINLKTIYEVKFDSVQLIQDAKIKIDAQLNIGDRIYEVKTGELEDGTADQNAGR